MENQATARINEYTRQWGWVMLVLNLAAGCAPVVQLGGPLMAEPAIRGEVAVMEDGYELPLRTWQPDGPPRAVLLALHGFNDYSNAFVLAGPELSQRGVAVYAYDQRGFGATATRGLWPAQERSIADAHQMLRLLQMRYPSVPIYLLGDSMGAAVTIAAITEPGAPPVAGVILNAPAVWGRETFNFFYRVSLWTVSHTIPGYKVTGESVRVTISDNYEILRQMSRDPLMIRETRFDAVYGLVQLMDSALDRAELLEQRVLVLYGLKDEVIPRRSVCRFVDRAADQVEVGFYPQGYHLLLRDLQAARVFADIERFIDGQPIGTKEEFLNAACPQQGAAIGS